MNLNIGVIPVFNQRLATPPDIAAHFILALTAEERTRSRLHATTEEGHPIYLQLPRGLTLKDGDWLQAETGELAQIHAKPEPVVTVTAQFPLSLLQAAYHLGNRHVPLEITSSYLRFSPDPVLQDLLAHRGLQVIEEVAPFQPEVGAYAGQHEHHHH
jgi:urease accessory protein